MMVHSWAASSLFGVRENQSMEACVARCSDGLFFRCLNRFNFRRSFKPMAFIHAASGSLSPSSLSEKILGNSLEIFKTIISCLFDSRKAMLGFFPFFFFFFFTFFVQNDGQYMHLIIHFICSSYWDIWKNYCWNAIIPRPPSLLVSNIYYHLNAVFYQWSDQHIIDLLKQREEGFGSWEERWNKVKWFKLGRNHVWLWL